MKLLRGAFPESRVVNGEGRTGVFTEMVARGDAGLVARGNAAVAATKCPMRCPA